MGINFPNPIRRFDPGRSCVCFWGSDASLEIAFQIEFEALRKLGPATGDGEANVLSVFDDNRAAILKVAASAYSRDRTSYHRLTAASF